MLGMVFYQALELLLRGKCRMWLDYRSVTLREGRHGTVTQREASTIGNANPDTGAASAHMQQFEINIELSFIEIGAARSFTILG